MVDRKTCMTEIWDKILRFNHKYFPDWRRTAEVYYGNALAGEVGEVCNSIKHRAGGGTNKSFPDNYQLMKELADCFIYIQMIVEKLGNDIELFARVVDEKIEENIKRMEESRKETIKGG